MDINNLQAFIEVAEKRSFSRSAETLKLTQPAVSKRIAALESELASRLFDRVGRTVHLTEAGKVLLPSALKISSEVSRIEDQISSLGKEVGGKLSIGSAEHVCANKLAPLLKAYRESYPEVEIDMQFHRTEETLDCIEHGTIDMGLVCSMDSGAVCKSHSRLRSLEIWGEKLVVAVEKRHQLARLDGVSISQLVAFPAIMPKDYLSMRKSVDNILSKQQAEVTVAIEATDFATIRSMASTGLGWACLPESEMDETLVALRVDGMELTHSVVLVRNPDRSLSRAAQAFVDAMPALLM